ncbi:MAG TPA: hypothetical protein VEA80_09320 [Vitreimonas sp.]|uniref:hypothetical protein n=1 Tax=Vitreimonas sp. TaxID=3069702 RepID=UPI002D6AD8BC|nr:hypothetical protein [Vitreimonas sp.]HYD87662.1 hypothetical protein [Vitreimonas sp.]
MQTIEDFFAGLSSGDLITLGLFVLSVFFGFLSWISRAALARVRRERDAAEEMRKLERNQMRAAVLAELLVWARMSNEAMAEANVVFRNKAPGQPIDATAAADLMARLSALVDTGRLYFPNHSGDLDWPSFRDRPSAMKGFRDPILDTLMLAHEELRHAANIDDNGAAEASNNIFSARRTFISELQDWVDPNSLGLGRFAVQAPRERKQEQDWSDVAPLVNNFEQRHGAGSFWAERPIARSVLQQQLREGKRS